MKMTYREALRRSLVEALSNNPKTFLMGEDVGAYGGTYAVSKGLLQEFGPERVRDTPLSEGGFVGAGIGAALGGLHPIVEIMTVNFSLLALDQIMNSAAFFSHMSGGQLNVPIIIRMTTGAGRQLAAQHSNSLEGWYAHIPGLIIITPATIEDARYSLSFALREPNPVLIFEQVMMLNSEDDCPELSPNFSIFKSKVRRIGNQLTLITYGSCLQKCLEATNELGKQHLSIEVIDLRVLRPLDMEPIYESVRKTKRVLIVDEGWQTGSLSGELIARITENCFYDLDAPIRRLCKKEVPVPYAKHLEEATLPQVDEIKTLIQEILK